MLNLFDNENIYAVIDTIKISIYWKDLDGKYLGCNKYVLDLLGLTGRKDIIGKTDFELIGFDVAEECRKNDRTALEKGIYEGEEFIVLANGKKIAYWSVKHQLRDDQGRVVGIAGSSSNIADHNLQMELKRQMELEKQRAIFDEKLKSSQIIDVVNASIYWKDLDGVILGCNEYALNMFGVSDRHEIIGKTEYDLIPEEEAKKITEIDQFVLENGRYEVEEIFTLPSGEKKIHYVVKNRLFDSKNNVIGIVGTSLDIAAKKEAERLNFEDHKIRLELEKRRAIQNENIKISQIIDMVNASIYWRDLDGVILGCNQYVVDMFGANNRQEVVGKNEYDLMSDEEAIRITKIDQSVWENGSYRGEENFTLPSGESKTYYTVKNRLLDSENNVIGMVGTSVDITAQKEAEQLRLENERKEIALLEQAKFVARAHKVSHDINSPLATLKMMMPSCVELPEDKRNILIRAINSILDIANNLLSTYRNEEPQPSADTEPRQPLLISDLLVQLLSEKRVQFSNLPVKLEIAIDANAQFSFAKMQPSQFRRTMSNLINNAVDAVDGRPDGVVTIKLAAYAEFVLIMIQDNGKGMTPAMIEKMLSRQNFTDGKKNGHGLGLQQAWDTLDNNEGVMDVDSEIGEGTSVHVAFPRVNAAGWIAQEIHPAANGIVVILDDDESIHGAWDSRFKPYLNSYPDLRSLHFTHGQQVLDFIDTLSPLDKSRVIFLSDFELIGQDKNGLQIIEESEIENAILVTSYYANPKIRAQAILLDIKILPKQMASIVPIHVNTKY